MAYQPVQRKPRPGPGLKGILLGLFAAALLPVGIASLFTGSLFDLLQSSLAFFLVVAAAVMTRKGLRATAEYEEKNLASAPTPYRLFGLVLASVASFEVAWLLNNYSILESLAFSILTALGYYLYYGLDPRAEKVIEGVGGYSTQELEEILNEARGKIADIERQQDRLGKTVLTDQITRIVGLANDVLGILEKKPKQLRQARKFLNVYLDGAQEVTVGYASMFDKTRNEDIHTNFRDVLNTIESSFIEQREKLLSNDLLDLDIQIEVLKKQMES